jgi:multiple sugar transport system substrate-binding protein
VDDYRNVIRSVRARRAKWHSGAREKPVCLHLLPLEQTATSRTFVKMKQLRRPTAIVALVLSAVTLTACGTPKAGLTGGDEPATVTLFATDSTKHNIRGAVETCNSSLEADGLTIDYKELSSSNPQEELTRKLSAKDTTVDIMAVPVEWTPEFAAAGWAEELRGAHKSTAMSGALAGPAASVTHEKKVYATPWTADAHVLWYRTDLIATPPTTWDEMMQTSATLAAQTRPHRVEIPALTTQDLAPFFVALTNTQGARILDKSAEHAEVGPETQAAAALLRRFVDSPAFDSSTADTAASRVAFETGQAAFLVDFAGTYVTPPKNVAMARLPGIDATHESHPVLAGTNLVVSSYSKHQKQAMKAIACLDGEAGQLALRKWALEPEVPSLLDNPIAKASIDDATAPLDTPVGESVYTAVNDVLTPIQAIDPAAINPKLEAAINTALDLRADR